MQQFRQQLNMNIIHVYSSLQNIHSLQILCKISLTVIKYFINAIQ